MGEHSFRDEQNIKLKSRQGFYVTLLSGAVASHLYSKLPDTRSFLPEPFDILDHIGNVTSSLTIGYYAGIIAAYGYLKASNADEVKTIAKTRSSAIAAGFAVGLIANAIVETKTGQNFIDWESTPDIIDLTYGVAGATAGASIPDYEYVGAQSPGSSFIPEKK